MSLDAMVRRRRGFTLIEMIIVFLVIAIAVFILIPALTHAREAARRVTCQNSMAQLVVAVHVYESAYGVFPPGTINLDGPIQNTPVGYHMAWTVQMAPNIESAPLFDAMDFSVGIYHERNRVFSGADVGFVQCPSDTYVAEASKESGLMQSSYAACHNGTETPIDTDNSGVMYLNSSVHNSRIHNSRIQNSRVHLAPSV